jgi:hypothetical protein
MKNSQWKLSESLPGKYTQMRLFPPTMEEVLLARIIELEQKLERQRKGQFAKIGRNDKAFREMEERISIIEKGLCQQSSCEILNMAVM